MKVLSSVLVAVSMLSACVVTERPAPKNTTVVVPQNSPRETTTVVVPEDSRTRVICQDGTKPPCP